MKNGKLEIKMGTFTNEKRTRYYGKRVGDTVINSHGHWPGNAEVVALGFTDNNRVTVKRESDGHTFDEVAEWLQVVKKVDDK